VRFWKTAFHWPRKADAVEVLRERLEEFRELVDKNNQVLDLIADAGEKLGGEYIFDIQYLRTLARELESAVRGVIDTLNAITGNRYPQLLDTVETIQNQIQGVLESRDVVPKADFVISMDQAAEELSDTVGEKMARLGEIRKTLCCRIPDGFVISTYACQRLLEEAAIEPSIEEWFNGQAQLGGSVIAERSARLQQQVLNTELPKDLSRAIRREVRSLKKSSSCRSLAIRSSALGEDGELSFAGQYRTILGVPPDQVLSAYRQVIASLYASNLMKYRQRGGLHPARGLMAVGCLCMIEAKASGVLYSFDPAQVQRDVLLVTAAKGLGKTVVEGASPVDRFEVSRQPPHEVVSRSIGHKQEMYVEEAGRGIKKVAVAKSECDAPAVTDSELRELAEIALTIEKYMKCAQDIEWALDLDGELFVLQSRPLRVSPPRIPSSLDVTELMNKYPVLMRNRGEVACRGIGYGRVHLVTEDRFDGVPDGAVLVARNSTPRLAAGLAKASAVITDVGTATGHLAAVAREFRVPTILDTEAATTLLRDAGEVTVDAEENVVYQGRVRELIRYELLRSSSYAEKAEFRLLRKMLKRIAPLNLIDPQSADFAAEKCSTYHDIIRFAHEKAMQQLTEGYWVRSPRGSPYVSRLDLDVPLDLIVIDLGGGLRVSSEGTSTAKVEDISSAPLLALIEGLTTEGVWVTAPADMDLDGFMSSATRSASLTVPLATRPEQNLALVSGEYLHLSLKLGYHFNIVDCYLTETRNDNFIYFRFAGGVTEMTRRSRRATLLRTILEKHDFVVEGRGDLVIGRMKKVSREAMVERLQMIGRLIGFTRQLDILLKDDRLVDICVDSFLKDRYDPLSA
jgi:pyruvate,water dikinase